MKILMFSWEYPPRSVGGIAPHVEQLSKALVRAGDEVHVVTYLEHNAEPEESDEGVFVHRVPMVSPAPRDFLTWVFQLNMNLMERAIRVTAEYGPFDVVHGHDWLVAYVCKAFKHAYTVPMVATIHATEAGRNWGLHNDLQRYISDVEWWIGYEAWRVICCSDYMLRELTRIFQMPKDKIAVIPNGIDPDDFTSIADISEFRCRYAAADEKMIFFVGRLVHEKGAHTLLTAMPKILSYYDKTKLVVAGKGPAADYLHSLARELGVWDRVYFTGYIDDETRNRLYKSADVAVVPSLYEPFGITALEAMAAKTPVVVADVGGLGSIVRHGENGYKFYSGNANSLADTVLHVLYSPQDAAKVRNQAYKEILEIYSWDKIARATRKVYSQVLDEFGESEWRRTSVLQEMGFGQQARPPWREAVIVQSVDAKYPRYQQTH